MKSATQSKVKVPKRIVIVRHKRRPVQPVPRTPLAILSTLAQR